MSQQINLFNPSLLRKRELLTAANLAIVAVVLLVGVGAWGTAERLQLQRLEAEAQGLAPETKSLQEQLVALTKQVEDAKPSPQLEAQLADAKSQLALRSDILAVLKRGVGGEGTSFGEYLRGLARQTISGLWLTGFSVGEDSAGIEIRGRMSDAAALPEYIRRLNGEKAFKGRAFATLTVDAGKGETTAVPGAAMPAQVAPASTASAPNYLEFILAPVQGAVSSTDSTESTKLASVLPLGDLPLPPDTIRPTNPGKVGMEAKR